MNEDLQGELGKQLVAAFPEWFAFKGLLRSKKVRLACLQGNSWLSFDEEGYLFTMFRIAEHYNWLLVVMNKTSGRAAIAEVYFGFHSIGAPASFEVHENQVVAAALALLEAQQRVKEMAL